MKKFILIGLLLVFLNGCDFNAYKPYLNKSQDTVYQGNTYHDKGAYLLVGLTRYEMTTDDVIDTSLLGIQDLIYTIEYEGVIYSITRRVMIIEALQFNVWLKPGIDTISLGGTWIDAGIESDQDFTYEVMGEVNTNEMGIYTIEYMITYENQTFVLIRYVNVV
jgi:hypothetical protein